MLLFASKRLAAGLALLLACLLSACESAPKAGQSGSENLPGSGGSTVPCPCRRGRVPALRVTVLAQDGANFKLRVEEVLHGELPLLPGDEIDADRGDDHLACYRGCASIAPGEQAFAFYFPAEPPLPACPEREACISTCEAAHAGSMREDGDGSYSCACRAEPPSDFVSVTGSRVCGMPLPALDGEVCVGPCTRDSLDRCPARPEQDYKRGSISLSPWGDTVVFARNARGEISLPASEIGQLWSDEGPDETENMLRCIERVGDWASLLEDAP